MTVDVAMVTANCRKNWPRMPVRNTEGMNTAVSTRAIAISAAANLLHGLVGGVARTEALADVAFDILHHDDGVVDHDADGE